MQASRDLFRACLLEARSGQAAEAKLARKDGAGGLIEAMVFGLLVGGSTTLCSAACNPTLAVTLGVATLQGQTLRGTAVLTVYAVGYSLPLAAAMIGLGMGVGKLTSVVTRLAPIVQKVAGVTLLVVGFILLTRI